MVSCRRCEFQQKGRHHFRRSFIEVAGRLVAEQQERPQNQGSRQRDALFLAARQLRGTVIQPVFQPHLTEQFPRALGVPGAIFRHQRWNQHILQNRALGQKAVVLEDETDGPVAKCRQFLFRDFVRIDAAQRHRAGGGRFQRLRRCRATCSCPRPMAP